MDTFSSNLQSLLSVQDVPPLLSYSSTSRHLKAEQMNSWQTDDLRSYTPHVIDNFANSNELDSYGYPGTVTYMNLNPVGIDSAGQSTSYASSDYFDYEYKPSLYEMNQSDILLNNTDEGYVSPGHPVNPLTPPTDALIQMNLRDSLNESSNSNDVNVVHGADEDKKNSEYRFPESPQSPRTQCVKCGRFEDIGQCWREASGHYLCYTCRTIANPNEENHDEPEEPVEEPVQKRTRRKSSAIANARNQICINCQCTTTTLWRRNPEGNTVCNACGLYRKLHNKPRPPSMRKDTIQTRRRRPRNTEAKKKALASAVGASLSSAQSPASSPRFSVPHSAPSPRYAAPVSVSPSRYVDAASGRCSVSPVAYSSAASIPLSSSPLTSASHSRVIAAHVYLPPPPPYNRYAASEETNQYQLLQPMASNNGFLTYPSESSFHHYSGDSLNQ